MSARDGRAVAAAATLVLGAGGLFAACELNHRYVDPHVSCDTGTCICVGGFDDCDEDGDTGCETDLSSDLANCGACGNVCANGECVGGSCACAPGWVDCDFDPQNGCEAHLADDAANCGSCGWSCGSGVCGDGTCLAATLGSIQANPVALAASDAEVVVAGCDPPLALTTTNGALSVPLGAPTGCALAVAISNGSAFFTDATSVGQIDVSTAQQTALASGAHPTRLLAVGPGHVYWWDDDEVTPKQELVRLDLGTQERVTLATGVIGALAVSADTAFWADASGVHLSAAGSPGVTDVSTPVQPTELAADGSSLYAIDAALGVVEISLASGEPTVLAPTTTARGIAVDPGYVYWADAADGSVRRVPRGGFGEETLVTGEAFGARVPLALNATDVYWIAGAKVRRIGKP